MYAPTLGDFMEITRGEKPENVAERWILSRLNRVIATVRKALDEFNFDVAARELYQFFWHEFCDWYLELAKPELNSEEPERARMAAAVALTVLSESLRLLHPFMPFVTEELWHHLPGTAGHIMVAPFPKVFKDWEDKEAERLIASLMEVTGGIRNARAELGIHPGAKIDLIAVPHSEAARRLLASQGQAIRNLARVRKINLLAPGDARPHGAATVILEDLELLIPLEGLVDLGEELRKLEKEEKKILKELDKIKKKLGNKNFLSKAPSEIVQKERKKREKFTAKLEKIRGRRKILRHLA